MGFFRTRLHVRVILHGVLLLGVSAASFLLIAIVLLGASMDRDLETFAQWFGAQACERWNRSPNAEAEIADFPAAVAIFSAEGKRLASSRNHPIPTLSSEQVARIRQGLPVPVEPGRFKLIACGDDASRYVIVGGPPTGLPVERLALLVLAVVALVAVGSVPLARSLVRPLRELVSTANAFGSGDLSARAKIDRTDEIGDLAHAFNGMAANLQAHLMAEKELLANVSHELRTPLARVRVVLDTAKEDPSRAAALLYEISRDLADLERLTDDVLATIRLDFSEAAPESAKLRIRPERVDLVALLQRAVARCVEANPEREIGLDAPDPIAPVMGDPALLRRLFDNLLENARKYSSKAIRVGVAQTGDAVSVTVADEGIGIEKADLARVFEPFFRSDRSRGRSSGGTGLGLTLCRRIAELHGGSITARSEPGVGTTVTIAFALAAPAEGPSR